MRVYVFVLLLIIGLIVFAPLVTSHDPLQTDTNSQLSPPDSSHWFGTDYLGRDVFSRVLYGGQITLSVALMGTFIATALGIMFAVLAYRFERFSVLWQGIIYVLLSIPNLLVALIILTLIGHGFVAIAIAIGASQVGRILYFIYSQFKLADSADFVEASRSLGASKLHILRHHIIITILPLLLVFIASTFAYAILNVATLSFLGLGGEPSQAEWGRMLSDGRNSFRLAPWVALYPGLAIFIVNSCIYRITDVLAKNRRS